MIRYALKTGDDFLHTWSMEDNFWLPAPDARASLLNVYMYVHELYIFTNNTAEQNSNCMSIVVSGDFNSEQTMLDTSDDKTFDKQKVITKRLEKAWNRQIPNIFCKQKLLPEVVWKKVVECRNWNFAEWNLGRSKWEMRLERQSTLATCFYRLCTPLELELWLVETVSTSAVRRQVEKLRMN